MELADVPHCNIDPIDTLHDVKHFEGLDLRVPTYIVSVCVLAPSPNVHSVGRLPLPLASCVSSPPTSSLLPAAIDCVVGSWGPWSPCTSPCGVGSTERSRQVSVPPRNGGTPCPDLRQRRGCYGNNAVCSTSKGEARVVAFLLRTQCVRIEAAVDKSPGL